MDYSLNNIIEPKLIQDLFTQTFTDSEGTDEGAMIGKLAHDLLVTTDIEDLNCFTAKQGDEICGAVIFTTLKSECGTNAALLSPMAVATKCQGQGVGQELISFALEIMKAVGTKLVVTYGDPQFYGKVGFEALDEAQIQAPHKLSHPHGWIGQSLDAGTALTLSGKTQCAPALDDAKFW
ncbi:N-acetyltransferase [Vibrio sp. SCSIO 43136]|uniref:GNAT family N-acetyltransferase n=1 Tax=Vibrio sp. SCSIO 43136 TaxID=2819101 RepID=UPI0020750B90|nr:N-acetyltransferase [Vibrio sp. SCSIO 43136]USD67084.1 N-acetyltransferase [Vibrio sp. SCSIO 43136]